MWVWHWHISLCRVPPFFFKIPCLQVLAVVHHQDLHWRHCQEGLWAAASVPGELHCTAEEEGSWASPATVCPQAQGVSGFHCLAPELPRLPFVGCKGSSAPNGPVHCPRVMTGVCCHQTVGGVIGTHRELGEEKNSFCAVVNAMHWFPPLQTLRTELLKPAEPQLLAMYLLLSSGKHEAKRVDLNLSQSLRITCLTWAGGVGSSTALVFSWSG